MKNWRKTQLKPAATIMQAIEVLNRESQRIVLVVDKGSKLLGTITDGDIRRALLSHNDMETELAEVMCKSPVVASAEDDSQAVLAMMKQSDVLQVPLIDDNGRVTGLKILQHILEPKRIDNPVFLMAGGFGTRLRPLTNDTPKPLLKVGSKPILETILTQFIESGFYNFYISTHYRADQIIDYFGDGKKWGVNISYVQEDKPLGTAGALGLLPKDIVQLPLIIMNGDLLTKLNLGQLLQFHTEQDCLATMCVCEYDFQIPYGVVVQEENKVSGIIEKPVHKFFVNAGIYVLESKIVKSVEKSRYIDMPTLLENHIAMGEKIAAFPIHEYWQDVGNEHDYKQAHHDLQQIGG